MRLDFCLLTVDDVPTSVSQAVGELSDHLSAQGFTLRQKIAEDLSEAGLRSLARSSGKDFNLVMVDYNLGRTDTNGAVAAAKLRREMQYTDMVFYSSESSVNLLAKLAEQNVEGVFVANRQTLGDALKGLADTVIGKAVDLSHMRGIAMAEVADMDVQMEEILEKVFASSDPCFGKKATRTLKRLSEGAQEHSKELAQYAEKGEILEVIVDPRLFPSAHKYRSIIRVIECLSDRPEAAIETLGTYIADVIDNRNTLAHAKEDHLADGSLSLRAIKRGKPAVSIDEAWMADFRGKLRTHREALGIVCETLRRHVDGLASGKKAQEG